MEQQHSIDDWILFLSKEQMPALAETVQKLNRLTVDEGARISQLTAQVLKDPSLTSRVLQVSNCVMYKGTGGSIKTITRAILMLGFTTVRDVTLSMQILDNILKHKPSQYLMSQIANSFHAAMQARGMLNNVKAAQQEEIFISTLLLHFAELSMLSRDDEISRRLNHLINQGRGPALVALEVLGCTFDELSLALARQWNLGDVLIEALMHPDVPSRPAQAVLLSDELSQVAQMGWHADPVRNVIKKIARFREVPFEDAEQQVIETANLAHEMAVHYGAARVRHLIPHSEPDADDIESPTGALRTGAKAPASAQAQGAAAGQVAGQAAGQTSGGKATAGTKPGETPPGAANAQPAHASAQAEDDGIEDMIALALSGGRAPAKPSATEKDAQAVTVVENGRAAVPSGVSNAELQINIMQELTRLIADKRMDVNKMLDLVLEGMHSAIGLDRVAMSLVSRDRKQLAPKFFKGHTDEAFRKGFQFRLDEENAFSACLLQSQQLWIGSKLMAGRAYLHTAQLHKVLNWKEYLVAPIIVSRKPIGIFYGDCALSQQPLNDQQYAGFNMLAQQAGLALTAVNG